MIEEEGIIIQVKGKTAVIKAERTSSCDSCSSRDTCVAGSGKEMLIEADNPVDAKPGERVIFTIGRGSVIKAGLILYLVPVVSLIIGAVLGATVGKAYFPSQNPDLVSGVTALIFLALTFIGLKAYSKAIEKRRDFRPHVLKVV